MPVLETVASHQVDARKRASLANERLALPPDPLAAEIEVLIGE